MSHPGYANPVPVAAVMQHLREAVADSHHEFWADDLSLLDEKLADATRIHRSRELTDLYLLALAVRHGGRFVTFDAGISIGAIKTAAKRHLVAL